MLQKPTTVLLGMACVTVPRNNKVTEKLTIWFPWLGQRDRIDMVFANKDFA